MTRRRASAACLAMLAACSAPPDETNLTTTRAAVVHGEPSPSGTADDSVVLLHTVIEGRDLICTATVVAPNLIVTARHCVSHFVEGPFRCTVRGELVDNDVNAGTIGLHLPADTIEFYSAALPRTEPIARGARVLSTLSTSLCLNDLAFVVLDKAIDLPPVPMRLGTPARKAEAVTLIGFGTQEFLPSGQLYDFHTAPRLKRTDLSIDSVGPDSIAAGVTTISPRTIVLVGASACVGDSGGPLLDSETHALLGVYSLLQGNLCDSPMARNSFVHVPPFTELIAQAFAAAGATPVAERETEPEPEPEPPGVMDANEAGADGSGDASSPDAPPPPPSSSSGGCSMAAEGCHPTALAAWLMLLAAAVAPGARRAFRQRRPSSGSAAAGSAPRVGEPFV